MFGRNANTGLRAKRAGAIALSAVMACSLSFPSVAFAKVNIDDVELVQGENAVGGGKATLSDSTLNMVDVNAYAVSTDEDLTMNLNGGNELEVINVEGDSSVSVNFDGENTVDHIWATQTADLTVNADGDAEIEEINGYDEASVTVNVTGENDLEKIVGYDNADLTVSGTDCPEKDIVNVGEGEGNAGIWTENGDLTIKNVTVNLQSEQAIVGSEGGNVVVDTAQIASDDDNEYALVEAGGTLDINESVINVVGMVRSVGKMLIKHSNLTVKLPSSKFSDGSPHRIWSATGIELVGMANGKVGAFMTNGRKAYFVNAGNEQNVILKADGTPAYYKCGNKKGSILAAAVPKTGDSNNPLVSLPIALAGAAISLVAVRRMRTEQ